MKKCAILVIIILFTVSTLPAFALGGCVKKVVQGTANCFQSTANGIDGLTSYLKGEKSTYTGTPTGAFQATKNFIENTVQASPVTRAKNLRGDPGELARRRGIR